LREGAKVEARYRGRSKYYPGRISRDRGDGTFDVDYDDGEKETRVLEEYIKSSGGGGGGGDDYREGDRIEAMYPHRVEVQSTAPPRRASRGDHPPLSKIGENAPPRYRGRSKWYPGKIGRDRRDGTYDVDYDDGEKETRVSKESRAARKAAGPRPDARRGRRGYESPPRRR